MLKALDEGAKAFFENKNIDWNEFLLFSGKSIDFFGVPFTPSAWNKVTEMTPWKLSIRWGCAFFSKWDLCGSLIDSSTNVLSGVELKTLSRLFQVSMLLAYSCRSSWKDTSMIIHSLGFICNSLYSSLKYQRSFIECAHSAMNRTSNGFDLSHHRIFIFKVKVEERKKNCPQMKSMRKYWFHSIVRMPTTPIVSARILHSTITISWTRHIITRIRLHIEGTPDDSITIPIDTGPSF